MSARSRVLVTLIDQNPLPHRRQKVTFSEDFKRFFTRGLAALLPTLITLWLLVWAWDFLWEALGRHLIYVLQTLWINLSGWGPVPDAPVIYIREYWAPERVRTRIVGVIAAVVLVYIVGLLLGNLIGRTFWKAGEALLMKIPIIRAIYPAVKQITDWVLAERSAKFVGSRVVAVQPHEQGIWSIGLVTGSGLQALDEKTGQEMVLVFCPNSPAAFSGYVLVVPRSQVVELPLTVEEAMRLFVSGGVIVPGAGAEEPVTLKQAIKEAVGGRRIEQPQRAAPPSGSPGAGEWSQT